MITFKQLETGLPPDIEIQTDDVDGEMADLAEAITEGEFIFHFPDERDDDGYFSLVITGDEAGEFSDFYEPLSDYLQAMNDKAIEAFGGDSDDSGS